MTKRMLKSSGHKRRRAWVGVGLTAAVVLTVAAMTVRGSWSPSLDPVPGEEPGTATASLQTMQKVVSGSGTVIPGVKEDINFAVAGTVSSVDVLVGDVVEVGDVLAAVDTLQVDADLLLAKADLAQAEADLVAARETNDGSGVSEAREAAAEAAVSVAESAVVDAEVSVTEAVLTASASGQIVSISLAVGDKVGAVTSASETEARSDGQSSAAAPVSDATASDVAGFSLVSTDTWSVSVDIGESDIDDIVEGQQVEFTADDGTRLFGVVSLVGLVPTTTSGAATYPVEVSVTGDGEGLHDGVAVDVDIVIERRLDVLTVPTAAITTTEEASTVQVVEEDGTVRAGEVTVGESSNDLTEVLSGLSEGDTVQLPSITPRVGARDGSDDAGGEAQQRPDVARQRPDIAQQRPGDNP